jgi:serine/threonine protein kinase
MATDVNGQLLGDRYRVIERLGAGGMATVYLAEDERLGRKVAVKRLHTDSPEDTAERFRREARIGASLNHPKVVTIYDAVTDEENVLIVMEYVEGETLADAMRGGAMEPDRLLLLLADIADALDYAHSNGIVHRDVKPANVLVDTNGGAKLADLGIATALEGTRMTMSGTVLGTAAYMSPEQLDGRDIVAASDVYSLATVAWEALAGRKAYEGRTPLEIAGQKLREPVPDLRDARPDAPAGVAEVLARGMATDPADRPASATELVDDLKRAIAAPPTGERRTAATAAIGAAGAAPPPRPDPPARARPAAGPARVPAYARHESRRGRPAWFVPVLALLALALAAGVIALASSGGDSSSGGNSSQQTGSQPSAKPARKKKAPAPATPATPANPQSGSSSNYQVPQPSGNDAAGGARQNDEGKRLSDAGDYAQAIPVLESAVRSFPAGTNDINYAFALFNLGHALRAGGRPADAVPVLEERLKIPNQRGTVQQELDLARSQAG